MKRIGAFILLVFSTANMASEEIKSAWTSSAEIGYVDVSGNTNTESLKAVFDVSYETPGWENKAHVDSLSAKSETVDTSVIPSVKKEEHTADKWMAMVQSNYKLGDYDYVYGLSNYEDDRFSGFDYQAKLGLGYGHRLVKTDRHKLGFEIGPGIRFYKYEQIVLAPEEKTHKETLVRGSLNYIWNISKTSKFSEELMYESGKEQDEWKSITSLTAKINSTLAMKVSRIVKNLKNVPVGSDRFDREASVTLVFSF